MCDKPKLRLLAGRHLRLSRRGDIARVFAGGRRAGDRRITILALPREQPGPSRMAVAVGKRYGSAVRRNRAKRLCREAFRLTRHSLPADTDFVILPRPGVELKLQTLAESIARLAGRVTRGQGHNGATGGASGAANQQEQAT